MEKPKQRIQLTLFVAAAYNRVIEDIRSRYNPQQFALIKSHVTLCREDELPQLELIKATLSELRASAIHMDFGPPVRFASGKGVLLPGTCPNNAFQYLRKIILKDLTEEPRIQEAHITLMHPRNSTCTAEIFDAISQADLPRFMTFNAISLIIQYPDQPWQVLETYPLG